MRTTAESKTANEPLTNRIFGRGKIMASEEKTVNDPESTFSFGVRELRTANVAQRQAVDPVPRLKVIDEDRGVDPYNTSGSFDRTKNWTRVGKR
jgi:hypothetical protein